METIGPVFDIIRTLRGPSGCAWDKKQTPESMLRCLVEEVYELQDAVVSDDLSNIREELGDVLFQLAFIIQVYQEADAVRLPDIIASVCEKMIRRHPHVYRDETVATEDQLLAAWERIKQEEKKAQGRQTPESAMDGIPKGMPALSRAWQVSKKAVKQGFDWDDMQGVIQTLRDEIDEFESAFENGTSRDVLLEIGDIFFTAVNVARFAKIYPETALAASTVKFENRYRQMEKTLKKGRTTLSALSRKEIDDLWESVKKDRQDQDR